jgi:hypothetical protein
MNEHSYTRAILKALPDEIHAQSMTSASLNNNGTPDRYIDGPGGDLWVEFKFLPRPPKILRPYELLSAHQLRWLQRRFEVGKNAVVVIGFKMSERRALGLVLEAANDWTVHHHKDDYMPLLRANNEVSTYLLGRVS